MPYADPQKNKDCKRRRYERNKTFRRRVKRLVFLLRGCVGTLTNPCMWQGDIPHVALQFDHREGEDNAEEVADQRGNLFKLGRKGKAETNVSKRPDDCSGYCGRCEALHGLNTADAMHRRPRNTLWQPDLPVGRAEAVGTVQPGLALLLVPAGADEWPRRLR